MKSILLLLLLPVVAFGQGMTWTFFGWSNDVAITGDDTPILWGVAKMDDYTKSVTDTLILEFSADLNTWTNIFSTVYTGQVVQCIIPTDTPGFVLPDDDSKEFYRWRSHSSYFHVKLTLEAYPMDESINNLALARFPNIDKQPSERPVSLPRHP